MKHDDTDRFSHSAILFSIGVLLPNHSFWHFKVALLPNRLKPAFVHSPAARRGAPSAHNQHRDPPPSDLSTSGRLAGVLAG